MISIFEAENGIFLKREGAVGLGAEKSKKDAGRDDQLASFIVVYTNSC